jgi:hypothetical protein
MPDEEGSSLTQTLQRSLIELTLAYDATLEGFGRALDLREGETVGRTSQVTEMTVELAKAHGIAEEILCTSNGMRSCTTLARWEFQSRSSENPASDHALGPLAKPQTLRPAGLDLVFYHGRVFRVLQTTSAIWRPKRIRGLAL